MRMIDFLVALVNIGMFPVICILFIRMIKLIRADTKKESTKK